MLNGEATGQFKGMARPGYFVIDAQGVIREKFFEAKYRERLSGNNVIGKLFPQLAQEVTGTVEAPHLQLAEAQSDDTAFPGGRVTLTLEVRLPSDVHVYAPGAADYKTIRLLLDPASDIRLQEPVFPRSKVLYLPAIKERVPVFEGTFRIRQDVEVSAASAFSSALSAEGRTIPIAGTVEYQACDRTTCFPPTSAKVAWRLRVLPLDRQRAPEAVRHR